MARPQEQVVCAAHAEGGVSRQVQGEGALRVRCKDLNGDDGQGRCRDRQALNAGSAVPRAYAAQQLEQVEVLTGAGRFAQRWLTAATAARSQSRCEAVAQLTPEAYHEHGRHCPRAARPSGRRSGTRRQTGCWRATGLREASEGDAIRAAPCGTGRDIRPILAELRVLQLALFGPDRSADRGQADAVSWSRLTQWLIYCCIECNTFSVHFIDISLSNT